jgi:hypothetical protein
MYDQNGHHILSPPFRQVEVGNRGQLRLRQARVIAGFCKCLSNSFKYMILIDIFSRSFYFGPSGSSHQAIWGRVNTIALMAWRVQPAMPARQDRGYD